MLTKGNLTRDELDHLLRLLNIMIFSMFHCSHSLSNRKQSAMTKRVQEGISGEGSAVAKPRPMNLVSRNFLSAKKTLRKIRVLRTARRIKSWIRVMFHSASGIDVNDLDNVDFILSNVQSSRKEVLLYVFDDNEAVIKMVIKERSPTLRHVSRTHRVALDWLFDRINLNPKIQIKHIHTKNQLADILTRKFLER